MTRFMDDLLQALRTSSESLMLDVTTKGNCVGELLSRISEQFFLIINKAFTEAIRNSLTTTLTMKGPLSNFKLTFSS